MIIIKSDPEIQIMKEACRITKGALLEAGSMIEAGVSTKQIDTAVRNYIVAHKARPSFLGYGGFKGSACVSVNEQVIHGIPSDNKILQEGDIVSVDVGACYKGFNGDCADTFFVGKVGKNAEKLVEVTRQSFFEALPYMRPGNRIGDIGNAVFSYADKFGYGVVREYVGHGVGKKLHEDPDIPNYGTKGHGVRLAKGMTIAVEPMINEGGCEVYGLKDGWTVVTADGKLSAHYENTVLITDSEPVILTQI